MKKSSVEQLILEILSKENTHLTSLQVFEEIRERLPAVNSSTVYRALERMSKRGIVSVSDIGTGAEVFEIVTTELHHHLVCQDCGRIITIGQEDVRAFFEVVEQKNDFKIITNHLILFGLCSECQKRDNLS